MPVQEHMKDLAKIRLMCITVETLKRTKLPFSKNDKNWMCHQWTVFIGE